jgi:hypothetical protein
VFEANISRIRVCGLQNENQNLNCDNINPVCDTKVISVQNVKCRGSSLLQIKRYRRIRKILLKTRSCLHLHTIIVSRRQTFVYTSQWRLQDRLTVFSVSLLILTNVILNYRKNYTEVVIMIKATSISATDHCHGVSKQNVPSLASCWIYLTLTVCTLGVKHLPLPNGWNWGSHGLPRQKGPDGNRSVFLKLVFAYAQDDRKCRDQ